MPTEQTPREKAIERIRNLLAKAYDPSVTEAEGLSYRNMARKLMDKYCVDEIGLRDPSVALPIIEKILVFKEGIRVDRNLYAILPGIPHVLAKFFGCFSVVQTSFDHWNHNEIRNILLFGYASNVEMVEYAVDVVIRQGLQAYREAYREMRSISFGPTFWSGFVDGLTEKFKIEVTSDEVGLELYDRIKQKKASMNLGVYEQQVVGSMDGNAAGFKSGSNVTLNKPIEVGKGGKFIG